jgi:SAM-dependent methyltransferase
MTPPQDDARKWDERYRCQERYNSFQQVRPLLAEYAGLLPHTGLALDAAMGLGGNAGFLLRRGLRVVGVDISAVAVRQAKARLPGLYAVIADLTAFHLPRAAFDVISNFYYLQRDLFQRYQQALRPGGILFFETLTVEMLSLDPTINPVYLLAPGELRRSFAYWEILFYEEGWVPSRRGKRHPAARLVARKI